MHSFAKHDHQMIGVNDDWTIDRVELNMESQTLSLALEFIWTKASLPTFFVFGRQKSNIQVSFSNTPPVARAFNA